MADFDTDLNLSIHQNVQDATTLTVADVAGGAVATVADIGASLWNSLPGTPEVETADLLRRTSTNALRVYEENPDTIQAASFIGGMFVPMGLAMKGMGLMRSGAKGASWFNYASREADMAKAAKLFEEAGAASKEYRSMVRGIYAKSAVNQAIDAVAMEAALVGMYNAHPFMEDYLENPIKNFGISAAFGGVIGGGVGHIADRFALRSLTGGVAASAFDDTIGTLRTIQPDMTNATALQSHWLNQKNLDNIMSQRAELGKNETNDLTYGIAKAAKQDIAVQQSKLFDEMISAEIKALPKEQKETLMNTILDKPEMFGVENISLLTEKEVTAKGIIKAPTFGLEDKPSLVATQSSKGPIAPTAKEAVYFPELGLYGTKKDAIHYAGASTLGKTGEQLAKDLPYNYGKIPNLDSSIELIGKSSAHAEAEYIAALVRVDKMSPKDLAKLNLSETDGPLLNAVVARMMNDPETAELVIKTSDRSPVYKQVLEKRTQELIGEGKIAATGPDASYTATVDRFFGGTKAATYDPRNSRKVSTEARVMLSGWIGGGGVAGMRRAASDYFSSKNGGYGAVIHHSDAKVEAAINSEMKAFGEIYESEGSKMLRAAFSQVADTEGNVYLYRGWKTDDIKGHATLESYTTHASKAEEYGTLKGGFKTGGVKLYKVAVDDIVAGFNDIKGASSTTTEIIVRAGARPVEATLDAEGNAIFKKGQAASAGQVVKTTIETTTVNTVEEGSKTAALADLQQILVSQKQEAIDTLIANGIPAHSIAKKTNTPVNIVEAWMALKQMPDTSLADLINPEAGILGLNSIKGVDDIEDALAATNQPIVLAGNLRKNQYVQNHIGLTNKAMADMNKEVMALTMISSKSSAAQDMGKFFYSEEYSRSLDIMKAQLGTVNNELAGSAFFNSFDFFARKMKDVGPVASFIGKQVQEIGNRLIGKVVEPIEKAMATVVTDAAATLEFNLAMDINASLKGWRGWTVDGKLVQRVSEIGEDGKPVTVLKPVQYDDGKGLKDFKVATPSVLNLIKEMQVESSELRNLANTIRKIQGSPDVNDIGFWAPSFNPVNKFVAYAHNKVTDETKLLWGRTQSEFDEAVNAYKKHLISTGNKEIEVYTKAEQEYWNTLNGRLDTIHMERADAAMQKKGSTSTVIPKSDNTIFTEIAGGYQHYISSQIRTLADLNLSEITDSLRRMSTINKAATANQPLDKIKKVVTQPKDAAAIVHNTLLGNPNLGEYAGWQSVNTSFETGLTMAANTLGDIWRATTAPLTRTLFGGRKELTAESMKKVDYEKFAKELEDRGIVNPYAQFDAEAAKMFGLSKLEESKDTSKRIIYASNALAATAALRFGEIAQPLVNAMSMPILTSLAIADRMPQHFMGAVKKTANVSGVSVMYDGARAMNSPLYKKLNDKWEEMGFFKPLVSEVNDIQRASRRFEKGATARLENAIDSAFVKFFSKSADYSEALTRKMAMNTGAVLAKKLYPELDDAGVTIFARDFMDKAIGNFHASQRPVFFQGTLGVALGLFQTYSLTLGQSIYRHLELKNYKALGKAALLQSSIFGTKSMPGFDVISNAIGDHFSDENIDLTTGTYRAVGDNVADFVLYGLPSNLGPSVNTRGDVDPRLPGVNGLVAYNFATQTAGMIGEVKRALDADSPDMGRALAQSLSLQSMSRPLARTAELVTGYSTTRQGNTVQVPEEVWTPTGVFARVLSTRPIEEQKLRDADHLNRFYGAVDRENREEVMKKIKNAIRNDNLTDEKLSEAAEKYFKNGGTPTGWRSALRTAIGKTETSGKEVFLERLKDDSPLNYMIDNLD